MTKPSADQAVLNLTCMDCHKECDTFEVLDNRDGDTDSQVWCYCAECDQQTFRDLPDN